MFSPEDWILLGALKPCEGQRKNTLQNIYISKIAIYLSLDLHKGRPTYRKTLQPSKESIQHFKAYILKFFSIFVGSFSLLDPDPDPKHWFLVDSRKVRYNKTYVRPTSEPCWLGRITPLTASPSLFANKLKAQSKYYIHALIFICNFYVCLQLLSPFLLYLHYRY